MICNSSPLICLSKIGKLGILKRLFEEIIITDEVKNEILEYRKPGYIEIEKAISEGWIKIINPKNSMDFGLDTGENSIINLAREINQKLIIDDNKAIKVAKSLNIICLRTTTIILKALNKGLINKNQAKLYIHKIVESGYYISPHYYSRLLQKIEVYKG